MEMLILTSLIISLLAGLYQLIGFRNALARWSGLVLLGISANLGGYFLLRTQLIPEFGKYLVAFQIGGYLLLDISYLVYIITFSGKAKWITPARMVLITSIPFVIVILMALRWEQMPSALASPTAGFGVVVNIRHARPGLLESLFVGYSNFVGIFSIALLLALVRNTSVHYRNTTLGLLGGTTMVVAAGLLDILGANPLQASSILQLATALTAIPITLIVFTWKTASSIPIGQDVFKDAMKAGFLILDEMDRVVDYNQAMIKLLGEGRSIETGHPISEYFPELGVSSSLDPDANPNRSTPILFKFHDLLYDVQVLEVQNDTHERVGKMVVFRNDMDRNEMEEALRKKNIDLSRTNAFLSSLARLSLSIQTISDPAKLMATLGTELDQLGLGCFVAIYPEGGDELIVSYLSLTGDVQKRLDKRLGRRVIGYRLDRARFAMIYQHLDNQHFYFDEAGTELRTFLEGAPRWLLIFLEDAQVISPRSKTLLVPLIAAEHVMGVIGVWGNVLEQSDASIFGVFASQIAWALERAALHEKESQRLRELSHSNSLIAALSRVSSTLETTADSDSVLATLGDELAKVGLSCSIVMLDAQKQNARIRYVSLKPDIQHAVERLLGLKLIDYQIPKKYWPGDRSIKEGIPTWYNKPEDVFQKLFPGFPAAVTKRAFQLVKGIRQGQLCFLPLRIQGDVIGVMPIWGKELSPADSVTLSLFGDQVAAILHRNALYENEILKTKELEHSNNMIVALSNVASLLDTTSNLAEVYKTLGTELLKAGLHCMVGTLDAAKQNLRIDYLSITGEITHMAGQMGLYWPKEIIVPRRLWPTEKVVVDKAPSWDPDPISGANKMFPFVPKPLFLKTFEMAGINPNASVSYLPMIIEDDVIGILAVWGHELKKEDVHGLSVFANQVATAIKNTDLYHQAQNEIIERTQAEQRIRAALEEKNVLLKEIHHRVKNNLQVISSLLNLQIRQTSDANSVSSLRESQNRVRAMALIHEKLYQSTDLAKINFSTYLQSLVYSLGQTYRIDPEKIGLQVQGDSVTLDIDTAVPCGLIVNELVTNSLKYAFPDGRTGRVAVNMQRDEAGKVNLVVCDDGVGFPPGFDPFDTQSLGLKLVSSLVSQLDGDIEIDGNGGVKFEIQFS